ncbi:hypothetical protein LJR231_002551 [Phyllobacterium sp. LjRoot231]
MAVEEDRAVVLEIDLTSHKKRMFAAGLRNPNGPSLKADDGSLGQRPNR